MLEKYKGLVEQLSLCERASDSQQSRIICRRALTDLPAMDADSAFYFGVKLLALLLAHEGSVLSDEQEEAIVLTECLLRLLECKPATKRLAVLHLQRAKVLADRKKGDTLENLRSAALHFEEALAIYTKEQDAFEWALTKVAAGETYWRIGEKDSRDRALSYHRDALTVFTPQRYPNEHEDYTFAIAEMQREERS
jgi:hypothetical protein